MFLLSANDMHGRCRALVYMYCSCRLCTDAHRKFAGRSGSGLGFAELYTPDECYMAASPN